MRLSRSIRWIASGLALLIGIPLFYHHVILDWQGRPYCHKQIMISFRIWMDDNYTNSVSKAFPNVGGVSRDSLASIQNEMGRMGWAKNYRYVPGLREDDPGNLVLMYVDRPTRWTWHGSPPTIFKEKRWILVPVDFDLRDRPPSGPGELSERVSTEEFKRRLKETIEFIRTNYRPNWQTIVAEHTRFLESLEHVDR